jgi:hypothetical protein
MPKYYIKIDQDQYIIDRKNYRTAIEDIIKNNPNKYNKGLAVYISEKGFYSNKWFCHKIDIFIP